MYTIIDVETTGSGADGHRITDIAIFVHDGTKILKEYQSLVDPEMNIPYWITELTGISDETVAGAPKFEDIAQDVLDLTQDCIFVAHSVNFDYGVIRGEFERLGIPFERTKVCTVKTARKLLPGHQSYSLGKICDDLGIEINGRHRAYGDARATVTLFEEIIKRADQDGLNILEFVGAKTKIVLPEKLNIEVYDKLPDRAGVYYFHNSFGQVVFIGGSDNIKRSVTKHFGVIGKSERGHKDFLLVADISFELTGTELIADLLKVSEVNMVMPELNRKRMRADKRVALFSYQNQDGLMEVGMCPLKSPGKKLFVFPTKEAARIRMDGLIRSHELCPARSGMKEEMHICPTCSNMKNSEACSTMEDKESYNSRVASALQTLNLPKKSFIIVEAGRTSEENAVVSVRNGVYQGYAFVDSEGLSLMNKEPWSTVKPQENNLFTEAIIMTYLDKKKKATVIHIDEDHER